ncbi:hypothetical protein LRS05_14910 [Flavobacterium sp. J372]|uniref:DUF5004 domain-containing protein n=1 Tax=Flavobacterium sp. J372 TaxID=2898436 RepID=UPI0021508023|nr:hypothetical protein [Flavobacterium sp. J372]MCR5863329.1 hypothetical protein [Flavobacterium sp. J372]
MKKLFFAAALIGLTLMSCGDDDSNPTTVNASIDGTWKLTGIILDDAYDFDGDGTASTNLVTETNCFNNSKLIFANGQIFITGEDVSISSEGTGSNAIYSFECDPADTAVSTYTVTDNQVIVGTGEDAAFLTRNGNTLTIYDEAATYISMISAGGTFYLDIPGTYIFTKQ